MGGEKQSRSGGSARLPTTLIIDLGLDPVQVSRQLGHAAPSITLDTYSHLFDQARHADDIRLWLASSGLAAGGPEGEVAGVPDGGLDGRVRYRAWR